MSIVSRTRTARSSADIVKIVNQLTGDLEFNTPQTLVAFALGLTFYMRRRIGARRWRYAHRFIVLVYVLGVAHALGAGSDAGGIWLRAILAASAIPIAVLLVLRYRPRPQRRPTPSTPARVTR